jgi:hypothetical protein
MADINDVFPSKHLKAADLKGRTARVTIDRYEFEMIGQGAQAQRKPVLYFRDKDKGLVLNKTNATNIALMHGSELDDWPGCDVELFTAMVDFQGKSTEAIRCKPVRSRAPATQARTTERDPPLADDGDSVPF